MSTHPPVPVVFSILHPNVRNHPPEDSLLTNSDGTCFAIADGVTAEEYTSSDYNQRTGPARAADLFCHHAISVLQQQHARIDRGALMEAARQANTAIRHYNAQMRRLPPPDYLDHDLFGAVAVAGCISHQWELGYLYIGDCGLMVMDKSKNLKLQTPNEVKRVEEYQKNLGFSSDRAAREYSHRVFRNRAAQMDPDGECIGYGVLTGEEGAMQFVRTNIMALAPGDSILLYSDGVVPFLDLPEFLQFLAAWRINGDSQVLGGRLRQLFDQYASNDPQRFGDDKALVLAAV